MWEKTRKVRRLFHKPNLNFLNLDFLNLHVVSRVFTVLHVYYI